MSRDPESLVLEYEYWRQILGDLSELIDVPSELAEQMVKVTTSGLMLATMIEARLTQDELDLYAEMMHTLAETMATAGGLQQKLSRMGDLVGGRLKAIEAEQSVDGG